MELNFSEETTCNKITALSVVINKCVALALYQRYNKMNFEILLG